MHITLVSCVAGKLDRPAPARELYTSDWFAKARAYAEAQGAPWFILSAEHGLVHPGRELAPYDTTLLAMNEWKRAAWALRVARQLRELVPTGAELEILAGKAYRCELVPLIHEDYRVSIPLAGLGIGSQKSRLIQLTKELQA